MKIVRIKTGKERKNKTDMFAVLCLVQSVIVILAVVLIFIISKTDGTAFSKTKDDIMRMYEKDMDIGGYFTPSEEKEEEESASVAVSASFVRVEDKVYKIKNAVEIYSSEPLPEVYPDTAVMPVAGTVTSKYGYREHPVYSGESFHTGRDIAASEGTSIHAVLDGTVTEASVARNAGKYIKIEHENGLVSLYCHCSELFVEEGINVRKGDVIASVGQTGLATGPHLHFELHENGRVTDPAKILDTASYVY